MPTNVTLPEDLLRRAEARAAEAGVSLAAYVADAVRDRVERSLPERPPAPSIPVSTRVGWLRAGVSLEKVQDLFDAEDRADGTFR